jgi:hypothetical protein
MPYSHLVFRVHAIQRMFQRQISDVDIRQALAMGNIIELSGRYPLPQLFGSRFLRLKAYTCSRGRQS